MASIEVEGIRYPVVENMGFSHSAGLYARMVRTPSGERVAVSFKARGPWRWWTAKDKLRGPRRISLNGAFLEQRGFRQRPDGSYFKGGN